MTSGGNNFNDFPENQLAKFRAVSPFPLVLISFGGTASLNKIFKGTAFPFDYTTAWVPTIDIPFDVEPISRLGD